MASHHNNGHANAARPGQDGESARKSTDQGSQHGLIAAIDGLCIAILQLNGMLQGLGQILDSRYSTPVEEADDLLDEETMAQRLGLKRRVLAQHRKSGRLPGCWVKNGRQVRWHVHDTLEAWKRGIA